jgi:hypothetical protein
LMCRLSAGWAIDNTTAAREKLPSSTTAENNLSCLISIALLSAGAAAAAYVEIGITVSTIVARKMLREWRLEQTPA